MTVLALKNHILQMVDKIENVKMLQDIEYLVAEYLHNQLENPPQSLNEYEKKHNSKRFSRLRKWLRNPSSNYFKTNS
jgi:hypothetical protein